MFIARGHRTQGQNDGQYEPDDQDRNGKRGPSPVQIEHSRDRRHARGLRDSVGTGLRSSRSLFLHGLPRLLTSHALLLGAQFCLKTPRLFLTCELCFASLPGFYERKFVSKTKLPFNACDHLFQSSEVLGAGRRAERRFSTNRLSDCILAQSGSDTTGISVRGGRREGAP